MIQDGGEEESSLKPPITRPEYLYSVLTSLQFRAEPRSELAAAARAACEAPNVSSTQIGDYRLVLDALQTATVQHQQPELVVEALRCIARLFAWSLLDEPALVDKAVEILWQLKLDMFSSPQVEMQIVAALSAAVVNDKYAISGPSLVHAINQIYQVVLFSRSDAAHHAAQISLSEMSRAVFDRFESRHNTFNDRRYSDNAHSLSDLQDMAVDEDVVDSDLAVCNAFVVFKGLCRFSKYSHQARIESHNLCAQTLSLHLLYLTVKSRATLFSQRHVELKFRNRKMPFFKAIKREFCAALSSVASSPIPQLYEISAEIVWLLTKKWFVEFKDLIKVLFTDVYLGNLDTASDQQVLCFLVLARRIFGDPVTLQNFNSRFGDSRILDRILAMVCKYAQADVVPSKIDAYEAARKRNFKVYDLESPLNIPMNARLGKKRAPFEYSKLVALEALVSYLRSLATLATPGSHAHLSQSLFEDIWMNLLAIFSVSFQSKCRNVVEFSLEGIEAALQVACRLDYELPRTSFASALAQFSGLNSDAVHLLRVRNIYAVHSLVRSAVTENMGDSWKYVYEVVSLLDRRLLISIGSRHLKSDFPPKLAPNLSEKIQEALRARKLDATVMKVFTESCKFPVHVAADSLRHLADRAIIEAEQGRQLLLHKLFDVCHYNISRPTPEWFQIWEQLGDSVKALCAHEDEAVASCALDSLRQLSMQFLDFEDDTELEFQANFLSPFARTMEVSDAKSREIVMTCLHQIVLFKANKLKSGWKSIFACLRWCYRHGQHKNSANELLSLVGSDSVIPLALPAYFEVLCAMVTSGDEDLAFQSFASLESASRSSQHVMDLGSMRQVVEALQRPVDNMKVKRRALRTLFAVLQEHGAQLPQAYWQAVLERAWPLVKSNVDELLQTVTTLFCVQFGALRSELPMLVDLFETSICEEDPEIGIACFLEFVESKAALFSDDEWSQITGFVDTMFAKRSYDFIMVEALGDLFKNGVVEQSLPAASKLKLARDLNASCARIQALPDFYGAYISAALPLLRHRGILGDEHEALSRNVAGLYKQILRTSKGGIDHSLMPVLALIFDGLLYFDKDELHSMVSPIYCDIIDVLRGDVDNDLRVAANAVLRKSELIET